MRCNPHRLYLWLKSSPLPVDDSELQEARSLVLFRLPTVVPPTRPMMALEGLEGLAGSCPPCSELGPGPVSGTNQVCLGCPKWSWIQPCLNFWGADMDPLGVMMVK